MKYAGLPQMDRRVLSMIEDLGPELVITDIKMPIMKRLENGKTMPGAVDLYHSGFYRSYRL